MLHIKLEFIMLVLKQEELFDEIDALWTKEASKRKTEIDTNSVSLIDGDEVFQKIAKRLNS